MNSWRTVPTEIGVGAVWAACPRTRAPRPASRAVGKRFNLTGGINCITTRRVFSIGNSLRNAGQGYSATQVGASDYTSGWPQDTQRRGCRNGFYREILAGSLNRFWVW